MPIWYSIIRIPKKGGEKMREIELYYIPCNNHGCMGKKVFVVPIDDRTGWVSGNMYCCRCFDGEDIPPIGTVVSLPDWCDSWESAKLERVFENSFSFAGETTVKPENLTVVSRPPVSTPPGFLFYKKRRKK